MHGIPHTYNTDVKGKNMASKKKEPAKQQVSKAKKEKEQQESLFTKEQILASKKYSDRRDALGVVLADGKEYTLKEAEALLEKFMKGKVN